MHVLTVWGSVQVRKSLKRCKSSGRQAGINNTLLKYRMKVGEKVLHRCKCFLRWFWVHSWSNRTMLTFTNVRNFIFYLPHIGIGLSHASFNINHIQWPKKWPNDSKFFNEVHWYIRYISSASSGNELIYQVFLCKNVSRVTGRRDSFSSSKPDSWPQQRSRSRAQNWEMAMNEPQIFSVVKFG